MEEIKVVLTDEAPQEIKKAVVEPTTVENTYIPKATQEKPEFISCLKNEKVFLEYVPREGGMISDPNHELYGGLSSTAKIKLVVPKLQSNVYKNVLTNDEMKFLENYMGLAPGAMSVYKKGADNYWANKGPKIGKEGKWFDLSDPEEYIMYKIALSDPDLVCPSKEHMKKFGKKATYKFVVVKESENTSNTLETLNYTTKAYIEFGKIQSDIDKMAMVYEMVTKRSINVKRLEDVVVNVSKIIQLAPKEFYEAATDVMLDTRILIKKSIEIGTIRQRGSFYYLAETNMPLSKTEVEPTLTNALNFLNLPKNQEIKFSLEAKLKG